MFSKGHEVLLESDRLETAEGCTLVQRVGETMSIFFILGMGGG